MLGIKTDDRWQEILNEQLIVLAEEAGNSAAEDTGILQEFTGMFVEAKTFPEKWKEYEWGRKLLRAIISWKRLCYEKMTTEFKWDIIEFKVQIFGEVPPAEWNSSKILERFDYTLIQDPKHDPEMEQILIDMAVSAGDVETGDVETGFVVAKIHEGETGGDLVIRNVKQNGQSKEVTFDEVNGGRRGLKLPLF